MPFTRITVGASSGTASPVARDEFWYDPDGQRFLGRESWDEAGVQKQARTIYLANLEEVIPASGSAFNLVQRTDVSATVRHIRTRTTGGSVATRFEYVYRDHLGSVDVVTNSTGVKLNDKVSFDAFGGRRQHTWGSDITAAAMTTILTNEDERFARGYTDHEMLNRTGFVHMNGRVYDPRLGRFVSPDPIVQFPTFSQSYNRYSYVLNRPLSYTDPSGFSLVGAKCEECVGNAIGVIGAVVAVGTGSPLIGAAVSTVLTWMSNNSGGSAGSITTSYVLGPPPPGGGGSGETGGTSEAAYGVGRALAEGDRRSASAEVVDGKWAGVADRTRVDPSLYKFVEMNVWEVSPRYESSDPPQYQLRSIREDLGIDVPVPGIPSPKGVRGRLLMMVVGEALSRKDLVRLSVLGETTVEIHEIVDVYRLRAMRMLDPYDTGRVLRTLDNTYVWRYSGQESLYRGSVTTENLINGCFIECFTIGD